MRIGELAQRAGVSVQTVRFYEREGLLPCPPRSASGYRCYDPADLRQLQTIKRLKALGFTLDDVRALASLRRQAVASGISVADRAGAQERILSRAEARLTALDQSLANLQSMRASLADVVERLTSKPVSDAELSPLMP